MRRLEIGRGESCRLSTLPCYTAKRSICSEDGAGLSERAFPRGLKPTSFCMGYVRAEARTLQIDPPTQKCLLRDGCKAHSPDELLRCEEHEHDCGENHELRVKKDEYAGVVEAPFALEAAGCLGHAPHSNQQSENLPVGAVEAF